MTSARLGYLLLPMLAGVGTGCHREQTYDTEVVLSRVSTVRTDPGGRPLTLDVELRYSQCPGTQIEVVRGDAAFAACMSKYPVAARVPARVVHRGSSFGRYASIVHRIGDCDRVVDADDEASYSLARDCRDWRIHDTRVGFQCTFEPNADLLEKCPWLRRR